MQSKPTIFVKRITNLSDARYCAGMGASMLGFVADAQDPDYVSPTYVNEIMGWVSGPAKVIEVGPSQKDLNSIALEYGADFLQINLEETIPSALHELPVRLILTLTADSLPKLDKLIKAGVKIGYLLLSKSANQFLAEKLRRYSIPVLIAITEAEELATDVQNKTEVAGFVLQGSSEIKPGLKDYDHLSEILEALDL